MSLLKLTPHLYCTSKHYLRRLQTRNFHPSSQLQKHRVDYPTDLPEVEHDEYGKLLTVYKFPFMTHAQLVYNAKYYLPLVYFPLWLVEGAVYASGDMNFDDLVLANVCKAVLLTKFLLVNKWLTHLIGFIYLTEDNELVIAHVNFRGRRIDEKFARGELVLESNKYKILDKLYVNLRCSATGRTFKLNLKWAEMNEMALNDYFGSLPESAF